MPTSSGALTETWPRSSTGIVSAVSSSTSRTVFVSALKAALT